MQHETKLTQRLVKSWKAMGAEVLTVMGSMFQTPGFPDTFVCHKNWTGWIEFKGPTTVIKPHQKRIIKAIGSTQSIFLVRYKYQEGTSWRYEVFDSNLISLVEIAEVGTDGQIAASLLKELKILEG